MYRYSFNSSFCIALCMGIFFVPESNALSWPSISEYRIPIVCAMGGIAVGATITGICAYIIGRRAVQKEHMIGQRLFNRMQTEFEATHDKTVDAWSAQVTQLKKDTIVLQKKAVMWHAYYDKSQDTIIGLHQTNRAQQQKINMLMQQNDELIKQCALLQKKVDLTL